jgi:hypothetical protein
MNHLAIHKESQPKTAKTNAPFFSPMVQKKLSEGSLQGSITPLIQRQPNTKSQQEYEKLVKQGKWCKDSAKSGKLHPGQQCYREIPISEGYPEGKQECFSIETGNWTESSPDNISAVSGQLENGECDIPISFLDPPNPFTHRGRRALGHLIADIAHEDPNMTGEYFGLGLGLLSGLSLPKDDSLALKLITPLITSSLGYILGKYSLPSIHKFAESRGYVPTINLGLGNNPNLKLGLGYEKRDEPILSLRAFKPILTMDAYLNFGVELNIGKDSKLGLSSSQIANIGLRLEPNGRGGFFGLTSIGAGFIGNENKLDFATSTQLGIGYGLTDFMDIQFVRETINSDKSYIIELKLVAPIKILKNIKH